MESAANNLHQTLHAARQVLGSYGLTCLTLEDGRLHLRCGGGARLTIDAEEFEAGLKQIDGPAGGDLSAYHSVLGLYRGDLLPEDLYEEWTAARRESLKQSCIQLLYRLAQLYEDRREYAGAVNALQEILKKDACQEAAHMGLMRLYELSGQRVQALRQFQELKETLAKELEVEPGEAARQLFREIQGRELQPLLHGGQRRTNLPAALTSFVGREAEIHQIHRLMTAEGARLLTVTGAGGTGKTRLAVQAARELVEFFSDGVWLVELAASTGADLVPAALAAAVGLHEQRGRPIKTVLLDFFRDRHSLILLDNCEHLLPAAVGLVEEILSACPRVCILTTSREILGLEGEIHLRCPSLSVPAEGRPTPAEVTACESVRLFLDRAALSCPDFTLTPLNAPAVAQICRRLDGIPLAIELAAARLRLLSVEQIAERLHISLQVLNIGSKSKVPRHRTLWAAVEWSYQLLEKEERRLLRRLAVFAGSWTLEEAEAVCTFPNARGSALHAGDLLGLLGRLADKSLVSVEHGEKETRYTMLQAVREYVTAHLLETGEDSLARDRHLDTYLALAEAAEPHLRAAQAPAWLHRLDQELGNLRAALDWSADRSPEKGLRLAAALQWYFYTRAYYLEYFTLVNRLLQSETAVQARVLRGRALSAAGYLGSFLSDPALRQHAWQQIQQAREIFEQTGAAGQQYLPMTLLRLQQRSQYFFAPPTELTGILELAVQVGDSLCAAEVYMRLGDRCLARGDLAGAAAFIAKSLDLHQEIGDLDGTGWNLYQLAQLEFNQHHWPRVFELQARSRAAFEALGHVEYIFHTAAFHIKIALSSGDYDQALRLGKAMLAAGQETACTAVVQVGAAFLFYAAWALADPAKASECFQEVYGADGELRIAQLPAEVRSLDAGRWALVRGDTARAGACLAARPLDDTTGSLPGVLAILRGDDRRGVTYLGAVYHVFPYVENTITPFERELVLRGLETAFNRLGEDAYQAAWSAGQNLDFDQANALAREICAGAAGGSTSAGADGGREA